MRNYYFTSVWVSVSGSGADSVLCSLFGVLYFRLEIIFLFRVLGFRLCFYAFFFRVLHVYFRVLSVCFVLRASRKTFSFLHCMILFCILWFCFYLVLPFWICVSVLCFGFPFWVLWYVFSLSATIYLTAVCL